MTAPHLARGYRFAGIHCGLRPDPDRLDLALNHVAHAILTTDTRTKISSQLLNLDGQEVRLTGVAKGAAMIGPNLATMLAFVFTDAAVASADLATLARRATADSFNCISVE